MRTNTLTIPALGLALLALMSALYVLNYEWYMHVFFGLGFIPYKFPFVDWDGVSASIKCWQLGVDVYRINPCDVLGRPHDYSPLWLRASFIPTDAPGNTIIGLGFAVGFILSLALIFRPRSWTETALFALATFSTMVVFALERANIDVLIFILIAGAGVLGSGTLRSRLGGYALIVFATLLKFYPLVALMCLLRERPRIFAGVTVLSICLVILAYLGYRDEFSAAVNLVPTGFFLSDRFGASNLPSGLAFVAANHYFPTLAQSTDYAAIVATMVPSTAAFPTAVRTASVAVLVFCVTVQAVLMVRSAALAQALRDAPAREMLFLVLGSALVVGCFLAGQNIGYRGIFLIFVVAGLAALHRSAVQPPLRRQLQGLLWIVLFLMWGEEFRHWLTKMTGTLPQAAFWLVRELLWWELVAALMGLLLIFVSQSETMAAVRAPIAGPKPVSS